MKEIVKKDKCSVDHVDTLSHTTNKKRYISIFTKPVSTKLDEIVAYDKQ